jgi:hypothetical protein
LLQRVQRVQHSPQVDLVRDSIFDKTSVITSTKHINAPVENVIATLHDFQTMINLNPLVTASVVDPKDPNTITITDSVPLFLGLSFPTTYTAHFEALPNGMNTNNSASAGVTLHNEWRAVANATGGTDLTETDTLTVRIFICCRRCNQADNEQCNPGELPHQRVCHVGADNFAQPADGHPRCPA